MDWNLQFFGGDFQDLGGNFPPKRPACNTGNSGSSKVIDFGTDRKRVCNFILMINSNLGPILHRFGDTVIYWSKNRQNRQFVPTQSQKSPSRGVTPIEFRDEPDISRN